MVDAFDDGMVDSHSDGVVDSFFVRYFQLVGGECRLVVCRELVSFDLRIIINIELVERASCSDFDGIRVYFPQTADKAFQNNA